ncbi:3-deoxy-manno-octulosonate cytidylyltransferase [Clostridium sp. KNHs214]|uniref:3-deoxy-manno-octulosonate cytidylyltransferase n=1 Tax=Clostridium sp. KNHs214 TaxID=1540257 RepID=UPI00055548ED|nr:3-deoxy-manno-octulosonate cytidylyltransferase [Clostridium sp. KNHs214]
MCNIIAIIPARYQSSRFPGKPLALINEKPMIQWVYERVSSVDKIKSVYVATDDQRIYDEVINFGGNAIITGEHNCGSNRLAEAINKIDGDFDIVLNIQGDEPMIKVEMILDLISAFEDENVYMATLKKEIKEDIEINNPNIAKLITDKNGYAIYFSRSTIPFNRDKIDNIKYYKHIGVYGYTKEFLKKFANLPQTSLEITEQLEQLRAIESGYKIKVIETKYQSIGVDLPEHIKIVEKEMKKEGVRY